MIHLKHYIRFVVYGLLCIAIVGCVSSKYVEHKQYLLNIKTLPEKKTIKKIAPGKYTIFVDHIRAMPPFDQLDFLYRISSGQYLADYYHGFLVSPAEQLEPVFINYLKATGNVNLDTTELSISQNHLQIQIVELYADYRDRIHPQAVVAMRFILTRLADNKQIVLLDKVLRTNVALKEKNSESLLVAWSEGVRNIFACGIKLLNKVQEGEGQ